MRGKFATFEEAEHRARLRQVRALMKERGIQYCISMAPNRFIIMAATIPG